MMAIFLMGALPASSAFAHGNHGTTPQAVSADPLAAAEAAPSPEARWLSGDQSAFGPVTDPRGVSGYGRLTTTIAP